MSQVRVMARNGPRKTYHNCVGVKGVHTSDGSQVTVTFKQVGAAIPWIEIRLPDDGDAVFVMDNQGKTEMAYRLTIPLSLPAQEDDKEGESKEGEPKERESKSNA